MQHHKIKLLLTIVFNLISNVGLESISFVQQKTIIDAIYLKFRDVRLSYAVSQNTLAKTPFTSLNLSLFGRNLAIVSSDVPYIDPQVITGSGNIQGLENAQVPPTRSFGINLSAKF